jgi:imidazolonepropionase-like amidohydrolase
VRDGVIVAVGREAELLWSRGGAAQDDPQVVDAEGGLVIPGFVDPHTHLLFGGERADEFEARLVHGRDYLAFVTVVADPGSPNPALGQEFAADLLVKTVSALRG